jgi:hypothetical protein
MMNIVTVDEPRKNPVEQKMRANSEQPASHDKFAEVRRARKKEKRARHRARLKRSNTDG